MYMCGNMKLSPGQVEAKVSQSRALMSISTVKTSLWQSRGLVWVTHGIPLIHVPCLWIKTGRPFSWTRRQQPTTRRHLSKSSTAATTPPLLHPDAATALFAVQSQAHPTVTSLTGFQPRGRKRSFFWPRPGTRVLGSVWTFPMGCYRTGQPGGW